MESGTGLDVLADRPTVEPSLLLGAKVRPEIDGGLGRAGGRGLFSRVRKATAIEGFGSPPGSVRCLGVGRRDSAPAHCSRALDLGHEPRPLGKRGVAP